MTFRAILAAAALVVSAASAQATTVAPYVHFSIDRSGSMGSAGLSQAFDFVVEGINTILDALPHAQIAISTFGNANDPIDHLTFQSNANRATLLSTVATLRSSSSARGGEELETAVLAALNLYEDTSPDR